MKRATRAALLEGVEGIDELLYEVVWRDCALPPGMLPADFLPSPSAAAARSQPFSRYLTDEGVEVADETDLQGEMGRGVVVLCALGAGNARVGTRAQAQS